MNGFSQLKQRIVSEVQQNSLLDKRGLWQKESEWLQIFNSTGVLGLLFDYRENFINLLSAPLAEHIGLQKQLLSLDEQYAVYMSLDPTSAQQMHHTHELYTNGVHFDCPGNFSLIDANGTLSEFCSYSFVITPPAEAEARYIVHLLCSSENMKLVSAHAKFDFLHLTRRESETLSLLLRGNNKQEIAQALNISVRTAEKYIANVLHSAGAANQLEFLSKIVA